jgi:hypothetical protein
MKKKIIGILVMTLFLVSAYGSATNYEILDQSQPILDLDNKLIPGYQNVQSFVPSLNKLSKVELYLYKSGNPSYTDIIFTIKDSQSEDNLAIVEKSVGEISTGWIELDFEDLNVKPGKTYYIVCKPIGDWNNDYGNLIRWGACLGNLYFSGSPWDIHEGIWRIIGHDVYEIDYCFKTYGFNNNPPEKPTIEGPTSGKTGTAYDYYFCSSDPDGDDIYYCVDWGDGSGEVCLGPYPSNTCITVSHTWTSDGTYIIKVKARDSNQAESEWATLSVSMPKSKSILNMNRGEFTAEIGVGDEEEPVVYLDGNYRLRGRFTVVYGTATNGEQEVRFQGLFRGNHFILQIPLRGKIVNIIGRCTIDENREFLGRWTARGTGINGWIKGTIN